MNIAMIPARMGSQRLKKKNLRTINGIPLIKWAIQRCKSANCFDQIWVNSEDPAFRQFADVEGVSFYQRPQKLGDNDATSEQYIANFLENTACTRVFQVHSIAPLLSASEIAGFVNAMVERDSDCQLGYEPIQIECAFENQPINFTFEKKQNSQDLNPIQRISWSITGWKRDAYLAAIGTGLNATYQAGQRAFYPVSSLASHVIKTEKDLQIAQALLSLAT
ncbi:MAG: cytidyltransferase [Verrucomicrobiota bacterium]